MTLKVPPLPSESSFTNRLRIIVCKLTHPGGIGMWSNFARGQRINAYLEATFTPEKAVLFNSYRAEQASDNQLALHHALRELNSEIPLYWTVRDKSVSLPEGAIGLVFESPEWFEKLGSVTHLCNNVEFYWYFKKRSHQKYLQTHHGHPFKAMGISQWANKRMNNRLVEHNLRRRSEWDFIVSPNDEAEDAYRKEFQFEGISINGGQPRCDDIVNADSELVRNRTLARLGVDPAKKVILFALKRPRFPAASF